jgi:hypothetical protein
VTDTDLANTAGWTTSTTNYTSNSTADNQTLRNDNGSTTVNDWDLLNTTPWSYNSMTVDAQARNDIQQVYNDNGSSYVNDWDQANANATALTTTTYDALGKQDFQVVTNDNGTYQVTDTDLANTAGWTTSTTNYTSNSTADNQTLRNDNGSTTENDWDLTNLAWSYSSTTKDAQGRIDYTDLKLDNGGFTFTDYTAATGAVAYTKWDDGNDGLGYRAYATNEYNYWDKDSAGRVRHNWQDAAGDNGWATYDSAGKRYACNIQDYGKYNNLTVAIITIDNGPGIATVSKYHFTGNGWFADVVNGNQYLSGGSNYSFAYNNWNTSGTSGNDWMKHEEVPWGVIDATDSLWDPTITQTFQEQNWNTVDDLLPMVNNDPYLTPQVDFEEQWNNEWLYW